MDARHRVRACAPATSPKRQRRAAKRVLCFTGRALSATLALLTLGGCAIFQPSAASQPSGSPKKVALRFNLAAPEPQEGYQRVADEAGQPLYYAAAPLLTENDVQGASVWSSPRRSLVLLEFSPRAVTALAQVTAAHVGGRLAIFVDDQLVASPPIRKPLTERKVYVDGGFTKVRAEEIVRGLAVRPVASPEKNP